jgi:hypothetical protein
MQHSITTVQLQPDHRNVFFRDFCPKGRNQCHEVVPLDVPEIGLPKNIIQYLLMPLMQDWVVP